MEVKEYVVRDPRETILQVLADKGMTQSQLADNIGTLRQNVNQMIARGKKAPRFDSFARLASGLGYEIVLRPAKK